MITGGGQEGEAFSKINIHSWYLVPGTWEQRSERPNVRCLYLGVGTVLCLKRDAWLFVK